MAENPKLQAAVLGAIGVLAIAVDAPMDETRQEVLRKQLEDLPPLDVIDALGRLAKGWKPAYGVRFPSIAEIREASQRLTPAALEAEALDALRRARQTRDVLVGEGSWINSRRVREQIGPAAALALDACGGSEGLDGMDESWAAKRWIETYVRARREEPAQYPAALPPHGHARVALPDRGPRSSDDSPKRLDLGTAVRGLLS